MTLSQRLRAAVFTAAVTTGAATAQAPIVPAGGSPQVPVAGQPCPCPPGPFMPGQVMPYMPGSAPVVPAQPTPGGTQPSAPGSTQPGSTPTTPTQPNSPAQPSTPSPSSPTQPNTPTPNSPTPQTNPTPAPPSAAPSAAADQSASATQAGTGTGGTSLPGIFGDFFGYGFTPVVPYNRVTNTAVVRPNIQITALDPRTNTIRPVTGVNRATDELLFGQVSRPVTTNVAAAQQTGDVVAVSNPSADSLRNNAVLIPNFTRGQLKITENELPRPTTRAYLTYNFFDSVGKASGPDIDRITLHQQTFGYEQAFADQQFSVGIRLPYTQLVGYGALRFVTDTTLGDLTIITKAVLTENRATGDLLSYGLAVTVPTGGRSDYLGITGNAPGRTTLLQPYLGYILTGGDVFLQGFSSVIVPTSSDEATLYTQSLALGYTLFKRPGNGFLTAVYPVFETHVNTALSTPRVVGAQGVDAGVNSFPTNVTLLGGTFFELYGRSTVGFAAGAPVTGPRPFSLQATFLTSIRF